ncbi:hypothetical protein TcCL_ESM07183 [Trypanosoma cruzi]|nr:hypothetical protein TcCL_ESM07183 [Trypanosoma cruzi]
MNFAQPEGNWGKERIPRGGIPIPAWPIRDNIPCLWKAVRQLNQRQRREEMCKLPEVAVTPPAHTKLRAVTGNESQCRVIQGPHAPRAHLRDPAMAAVRSRTSVERDWDGLVRHFHR